MSLGRYVFKKGEILGNLEHRVSAEPGKAWNFVSEVPVLEKLRIK